MNAAAAAAGLWPEVVAAAAQPHPAGRIAALSSVAGVPRLGWVRPPPWPQVVRVLAPTIELLHTPRLVLVGTGGWAFGARTLAGTAAARDRLRVCDQLDPDRLAAAAAGRPRPAVLAVSESGRTTETVALANALQQWLGLTVRWLTDDAVSLDPAAPTTALFAAPLSVPFLLAAAAAGGHRTGGLADLSIAYRAFARRVDDIGQWAAQAAGQVPGGRCVIRVELPRGSGAGLAMFALQALRQGLGGKDGTARPWLEVAVAGARSATPADLLLALPDDSDCPPRVGRLMARCYAICALVACIGVRLGIAFASHPGVARYKRLLAKPGPAPIAVPPTQIVPQSARWLREHGFAAGHLVCYEPRLLPRLARARPRLAMETGRAWEVHAGSSWNHHSYQAVQAEPDIGVVAVAPADQRHPLSCRQLEIATATCASLDGRALLLRPDPGVAR